MKAPEHHFFVCSSFRHNGEAKGMCQRNGSKDLLQLLEEGILERNLDAQVTSTGCLKVCDRGPVMVVHPGAHWYGKVDEERLEQILDAVEEGRVAESCLLEG
jgi:(2Fe-2S) ferredoxin